MSRRLSTRREPRATQGCGADAPESALEHGCGERRRGDPRGRRAAVVSPLSHVFERVSLYLFLLLGCHVSFCRIAADGVPDLVRVRPTVMTGVPRVFEKFHHAVLDAVANAPSPGRPSSIGDARRVGGLRARLAGRRPPLWAVLLRPLRTRSCSARSGAGRRASAAHGIGKRAAGAHDGRVSLCGGIADHRGLRPHGEFPGITANPPDKVRLGTVGIPIPGVEVRIADDGEVLARGPNIMQGYFNRPDETAAALRDGWLHTGDIGHLDADGYLTITDRKKDLIVTSAEEHRTRPDRAAAEGQPLVSEAVLVGDRRNFPAALIIPTSSCSRNDCGRRVPRQDRASSWWRAQTSRRSTRPFSTRSTSTSLSSRRSSGSRSCQGNDD